MARATERPDAPLRVLIAGGGVASLEALLALRDLAGDRVEVEILSPQPELEYRPLAVAEPAAEIIGREPSALQLRYLQTLLEVGADQNSTIVFPLPLDLIKPFLERAGIDPPSLGGERPGSD